MLEPQLFAIVDATDHASVYCFGVDTGDGAFTCRRDPLTGQTVTGHSNSMYSAFTLANRLVRGQARFDMVIYKSNEDDVVQYKEGVCPACNNERTVSIDCDDIFPPGITATLDNIPCPECTDEHGTVSGNHAGVGSDASNVTR